MKDFFEKAWDYQTKSTTLWFVALLHVPWQEILQENNVPLLHRRRGQFCVHHVWFLDPVNIRDFFERFQDYQAKYDIIFLEPDLFLEVWTIKNTPVLPECACSDILDHTCSDASDGSITVWCLLRNCCCMCWFCWMQATAASLVPVTKPRPGGSDAQRPLTPRALSLPTPQLGILVLLWPPVSQQQRPSRAVLIAPTPSPPSPCPYVIMEKHNV